MTAGSAALAPVERPTPASDISVLVAVQSHAVREALAAMLSARDGFRVVGEAADDDQALALARQVRPHLAIVDLELSGCGGWWLIQSLQRERLARVVVALGHRGDDVAAILAGAQAYVQMGTAPRDLLRAVEAAIAHAGSGTEAEHDLLADAHAVL